MAGPLLLALSGLSLGSISEAKAAELSKSEDALSGAAVTDASPRRALGGETKAAAESPKKHTGANIQADMQAETSPRWALAIHGGAGTITRANMTPQTEREYRAAMDAALAAGEAVLRAGGDAVEAVTAVLTRLEDDPKFNAGRGAVFTWDGRNEMDASIMNGAGRKAGAIAGVGRVKNPILLAKAVMEDGRHVMLSGAGAEQFAADKGLTLVDPGYFATPRREKQLQDFKAASESGKVALGQRPASERAPYKYGTVGAVARDVEGHLAAGTSTGGTTGKRWGRIGDSPIIGAGTYADDGLCAVSATGTGEYFIRVNAAKAICDRMGLAEEGPQQAADHVIADIGALGGDGGVIVLSAKGEPTFSFNTEGMYRGRANSEGLREIAIYGADEEKDEQK